MEFSQVIETRRSVRRFTDKPVPDEVIRKALQEALLAPNSSNMQPWEFYWVKSAEKKKALVKACFSQPAAATAQHLIVAVARVDHWKRNRNQMLERLQAVPRIPKPALDYYRKIVPMMYGHGPFSVLGIFKKLMMTVVGFFRPVPRGPFSVCGTLTVAIKTTALACENLMLSLVNQGYGTCPMEGFDERRIKKLLKLPCKSRVVMCISTGETDPNGVWGDRIRLPDQQFLFEV